MPELEPGSGEGQNHFNKQMFNERDGRPIKTSGCVQPADHGPCCWWQTEDILRRAMRICSKKAPV